MYPNDSSQFHSAITAHETKEAEADTLSNMARDFLQLSNYEEAKNAAESALAAAREAGSALQEARALYYLGRIFFYRSEYQAALTHYLRALEVFEAIGDKGRIAIALGNIGSVYRNLSDYPSAVEYYHKALAIDEDLGNKQGIANHTGNIGNVYFFLSDYPNALIYYRKALALSEELGNVSGIAIHTGNLGSVYLNLTDYTNALEYYRQSLAISNKLDNKLSEAIHLGNIAGVYYFLNDYPTSLEYYRQALVLYEALGSKSGIAEINGNIGTLYKQRGDYHKALEYHDKALLMNEELGNVSGVANNCLNIGALFSDVDFNEYDPAQATRYYLRAAALFEQLGTKKELYETHLHFSELYTQTGDWAKAYKHHKLFHNLEKEVQSEEAKKQAEQLDYERKTAEREKQRAVERAKHAATEQLLHNVLPPGIAAKMLGGATLIAEKLDNVSVLFADIVGFTTLSQSITPEELVQGLDLIFSEFDGLAEKYGLEKIKTIGDAYMVVSGAPVPRADHAHALAAMAVEMGESLKKFASIATGAPIEIRIGIHTGEVVAGVIGKKKFAYDLWGDAVNTAARMESHGAAGKIHVTEEFIKALGFRSENVEMNEELPQSRINYPPFSVCFRGEMEIRGKGKMRTYFLDARP